MRSLNELQDNPERCAEVIHDAQTVLRVLMFSGRNHTRDVPIHLMPQLEELEQRIRDGLVEP